MCIKCAPEDDTLGDETCWSDIWLTECYTDTTQKLPVEVDTKIEFRNKTNLSDNTGNFVSCNTPHWMTYLSDAAVNIFEVTPSINSTFAIFGLCQYCIQ